MINSAECRVADKSASNRDEIHRLCGTRKVTGKEVEDIWQMHPSVLLGWRWDSAIHAGMNTQLLDGSVNHPSCMSNHAEMIAWWLAMSVGRRLCFGFPSMTLRPMIGWECRKICSSLRYLGREMTPN